MIESDKKILEDLKNDINKNIDRYSTNIFVCVFGSMGSGKSTYIKNNLLKKEKTDNKKDMYYVSTDTFIKNMKDRSDSYTNYKRSREIGIKLTDYLLEKRVSMLCEGTGQNDDIFDFLKRLKDAQYSINIIVLDVPLSICIERVKKRNKDSLRKISAEDVVKSHNILWKRNLSKLKEFADTYKIVS